MNTLDIVKKERNTQNQGSKGSDTKTRVKMGPASSHQAGNPTTKGGINRPAKGK